MVFFFEEIIEDAEDTTITNGLDKIETGCWAIDFVPKFESLEKLVYPNRILEKFKNLVIDGEIPYHINIQGHRGCGKWTIIKSVIYQCYKNTLDCVKPSSDCEYILYSNNIFIVDFKNLTNAETVSTIKYLKTLSQQKGFIGTMKILILKNIDKVEKHIQLGLSKLYEHNNNIRIITTTIAYNSNIIINLKSRISLMIIPKLNDSEIKCYISNICKFHNEKTLSSSEILKVYNATDYSLRDTILIIQSLVQKGEKFKPLFIYSFINELLNLCCNISGGRGEIIKSDIYQNITRVLYSIIALGVEPELIVRMMLKKILNHKTIGSEMKSAIVELAGSSSKNLSICDKSIFHLEHFVFNIVSIISKGIK